MMTIKIVYLSKNQVFHVCTKHIEVLHHLMQKKVEEGFVKLMYYNMENMVVDILTKGFFVDNQEYFQHLMGVIKCII